ncbi:MAG: ABC transporter ATP-binding protein, partial [Candidatus Binatia bacterium]
MTTVRERLRRALPHLPYLPRALSLVWEATRLWMAAWVALLVVQGLLPVATVYLTRELVNRLVAAAGGGGEWSTVQPVFVYVIAFGAVFVVAEALSGAGRWIRAAQSDLIQDHIAGLIHEKSTAVDLAFYELPEFYDHLHRARDESGGRSVALLDGLAGIAQNSITMVAMIAVLIPYGPWLAIALLVNTAPAIYVVVRHARYEHRWWRTHTEELRYGWYYDWLLTAGASAAELRLFGLGDHFQAASRKLREHLREQRLRLVRGRTAAEAQAGLAALFVGGGAGLWMVWRTVQGFLTIGDLALAYQAFQNGQALMRTLLGSVGQLYGNVLFLGSLFEFLALPSRLAEVDEPTEVPSPFAEGIRFEGVSFRYPGSERPVFEDLDLVLPAGRLVAIVGPNGAGKTTLIKLLCRFYDPEAGRIAIDGIDLKSFALAELRRAITVVFQQPVHHNATVAENIAFGDLSSAPDRGRIEAAADEAGARQFIRRLPRGFDTTLGGWFAGGTELSVGEWQRVALARAFLRQAPIVLLDEPTSAMDSWAESDWLARFRTLAQGRTTLMITHRFTTAMRADVIHVMVDGRI